MNFGILGKFFVLFFLCGSVLWAQPKPAEPAISLSNSTFFVNEPFAITLLLPTADNRPDVAFPAISGFRKKGISTQVLPADDNNPTARLLIRQEYVALQAGTYRLAPFSLNLPTQTVRSAGATLTVRDTAPSLAAMEIPDKQAAFLQLKTSTNSLFAGENVVLTLSFYVADNYPYELKFKALDQQLREIISRIRPANAWEESLNISELRPISITFNRRRYREYRLYQAVFFPLTARVLRLPPVSLQMERPRPKIGPPTDLPENVSFTSRPVTITIRPLPPHPLKERVPVGQFHLVERLERTAVRIGKSTQYALTIAGNGNIATLPAPTLLPTTDGADIFPPQERVSLTRTNTGVSGEKMFTYFIVPHQNGTVLLANRFEWIYFNPKLARYDTLRPAQRLYVSGESEAVTVSTTADATSLVPAQAAVAGQTLYAGLEKRDSLEQGFDWERLFRLVTNALIGLMLVGLVALYFKK